MKVALITGASRGIGAQCARKLAQNGWQVIINYKNSKQAALSLANELGTIAICADVAVDEQVSAMFEQIEQAYGGVELLVNNAGIAYQGLLTDMSYEQWRHIFSVNVDGVFSCTKYALPYMIRQHKGSVINISSMWGVCGASCEVAYSASKAAVIGLTKALSKEVGPSGIRVNCIAPGVIDTDMNMSLDEDTMCQLREETPLGVIGKAEDIAEAVNFLASASSGFITGQVLGVNGGFVI